MTTVYETEKPLETIDVSPYRESIELVAPNIATLIASSATVGENWWNTLARILPFIACTVNQAELLTDLANRAASGLMPVGYVAPVQTMTGTPTRITAEKFLTYAGVVGVLWKLFY